MAARQPIVLDVKSIADLVDYILPRHADPSTLVICGSKAEFFGWVQQTAGEEDASHNAEVSGAIRHRFAPTLRLLFSSPSVKVVFCPTVANLRAYLMVYPSKVHERQSRVQDMATGEAMLAILNPIRLHRRTSAFSAQGLNRTFAAAVEAAYHSGSKLVLAEVPVQHEQPDDAEFPDLSEDSPSSSPASQDPWDVEVSMLNVSTKTFGPGERGWVGRTVKVRDIAQRWCTFKVHPTPAE